MNILPKEGERFKPGAFDGMIGRSIVLQMGGRPMVCVVRWAKTARGGSNAALGIEPDAPIKFVLDEDTDPSAFSPERRRAIARMESPND